MLSKQKAFEQTKAAQLKVIEDKIIATTLQGEFETEILNLTDEEKAILTEAGYSLTYTGGREGFIWKINWHMETKPEMSLGEAQELRRKYIKEDQEAEKLKQNN